MAKKDATIQMRIDSDVKKKLEEKAEQSGLGNLTEYLTFVGLNAEIKVSVTKVKDLKS